MAMLPLAVAIVTVRVSLAASAAGWLVGQSGGYVVAPEGPGETAGAALGAIDPTGGTVPAEPLPVHAAATRARPSRATSRDGWRRIMRRPPGRGEGLSLIH